MTNALQPSSLYPKRRSVRIPLSLRVTVRLANDAEMESETVRVSRYGAELRLPAFERPIVCGDHVRICLRGSYTWRRGRIAWIDRGAGHFGVELHDPENFWNVHFPDKAEDSDENPSPPPYTPLAIRARSR